MTDISEREPEGHARVRAALAVLHDREIDPPPYLLESILEKTRPRRLFLIPPVPPQDILRALEEHRDAIVSAAGAAMLAAGAFYALWRVARGVRSRLAPAG